MRTLHLRSINSLFALFGLGVIILPGLSQQPQPAKSYKVTIVEENKPEVFEQVLPADPTVRVGYNYNGNMIFGVTAEGKRLTPNPDSVQTLFMIDGEIKSPKDTSKLQSLPEGPGGKKRHGGATTWQQGDLRVTMTLEVIAGKPSQLKPGVPIPRRLDTLLVKYGIENIGNAAHKVACRVFIDTMVGDNDGALFASPTTHPKKILNGLLLEKKLLPEFMEVLERPNLDNPGFKGIFTFKLGNKLEGPSKVALTSFGARNGKWDVPVVQSGGDSACAFYWEQQEIQPQGKREIAYAYGQGIAATNDGRILADFGGSFEPGKRFTITAYVDDPIDGQNLTLLLPKGIELVDGKTTQAVPAMTETGNSVVMWRCRLQEAGAYPIRIRSSTGVTKTWSVTVSPAD